MKKIINSKLAIVAAALLSMTVATAVWLWPSAPNAQAWDGEGDELRGLWDVTTTQTNCDTGQPVAPSFKALITFAAEGTMLETTTNPAFAPGQRSVGEGVWKFDGHRRYFAKSKAFLNFTTPATMTPPNPGFEAGYQILSQNIEFKEGERDRWTSAATTQFFDTAGTVYRSGCATAVAQRFE
jgi:hypothetical protein